MPALALSRVVLGLLIAPLAAAPVLLLLWCLLDAASGFGCVAPSSDWDSVKFLLWLVVLCGYPPVLILGVPLLFVMRRHGYLRPLPLAVAGAGIALVASGLFFLVEESFSVSGMLLLATFSFTTGVPVVGAFAGLAFWAIGVFRNRVLAMPAI